MRQWLIQIQRGTITDMGKISTGNRGKADHQYQDEDRQQFYTV
ncbi:MAG TPA: hypothetical protein VM012_05530 [Flavitalea sp.]|nr:hypothetical protein [Flavitalea sp.]